MPLKSCEVMNIQIEHAEGYTALCARQCGVSDKAKWDAHSVRSYGNPTLR